MFIEYLIYLFLRSFNNIIYKYYIHMPFTTSLWYHNTPADYITSHPVQYNNKTVRL